MIGGSLDDADSVARVLGGNIIRGGHTRYANRLGAWHSGVPSGQRHGDGQVFNTRAAAAMRVADQRVSVVMIVICVRLAIGKVICGLDS